MPAVINSTAVSQHAHPGARVAGAVSWRGVELLLEKQDIREPSTWLLHGDEHALIVHLGGPIRRVETQVDGIGSEVAPLGTGQISLVPAGHYYACRAQGGVITFGTLRIQSRALALIVGAEKTPELRLELGRRDAFVYESMRRLAALAGKSDDVSQMIGAGIIQALCGHVYQSYRLGAADQTTAFQTVAPPIAQRLREFVMDNLAERITLSALAHAAGLSMRELFSAFRREFNTTPAQYVIEQRLERARWLLMSTRRDITAIALATGFASHSHMTTAFKKHLGLTPRALRSGEPTG